MALAIVTHTVDAASNPYWIALIAVGGTVVGAAISAMTQALSSRRSSTSQLLAIHLQLDHATQEAIRQDRQRAYARFLLAAHSWNLLYLDVYDAVKDKKEPPNTQDADNEYVVAHSELDLLAGEEVARLVTNFYVQQTELMIKAKNGENVSAILTKHDKSMITLSALTAAMQRELGISGIPVDPATGLRTWPTADKTQSESS